MYVHVYNFCHEGFTFHVSTGYVAMVITQCDLHTSDLCPHPQVPLSGGREERGGARGRLGGACTRERENGGEIDEMEEWRRRDVKSFLDSALR